MIKSIPRILIAGTHSGVGKTSLTLGITAALASQGLRVQTYKVGPDYLDPSYLAKASGNPCYNLDGWMMGQEYVRQLFVRTAASADIAIIEGVMGLFDGASSHDSSGSTAQIARWLNAPVILVVNVHGMARSLAALVKGFSGFDPGLNLAGVVANQCGSGRHAAYLKDSLVSSGCPSLMGALPRNSLPVLPSRHLGLVTADSTNLNQSTLTGLADAVKKHISLDKLLDQARLTAPVSAARKKSPVEKVFVRLGVAYDEAFHFYYQDVFDEMEMRGCEMICFSPVHDKHLPERIHGLYLGGGYPEQYAEELSNNRGMLESIRSFITQGRPVYGECGGLMYLSKGVRIANDEEYQFVGGLPAWTRMLERREALGYVEVTLEEDTLLGKRGAKIRGHEFHYSKLENGPGLNSGWQRVYSLQKAQAQERTAEGFQRANILASYVHLHLPSRPEALEYFLDQCRRNR